MISDEEEENVGCQSRNGAVKDHKVDQKTCDEDKELL